VLAVGMGLTMAPATESIMGSLPRAKAGVGSAVNDTTRQVGGALGVAIVGSVMSSVYVNQINKAIARQPVPPAARTAIRDSLGHALKVAQQLPGQAGRQLSSAAKDAFVAGLHRGVLVASAAALLGAIIAIRWLPASGTEHESSFAPGAGEPPDEAAVHEPALVDVP
jgi:hypothetical protein